MYAVLPDESEHGQEGLPVTDRGVVGGLHILVGEHSIPGPSPADRLAIARYAALMYQRAPKTEAAILRWGEAYDLGIHDAVVRVAPQLHNVGPFTGLAYRRARMVDLARRIGTILDTASWWVVRAGRGQEFVLGDTPMVSTTDLGVDGDWHAILEQDVFTVVMPLGPTVALLMAPRHVFPVSEMGFDEIGPAINRLVWWSADRYVIGRSRGHLEGAVPGADDAFRRSSVSAKHDAPAIAAKGAALAQRILAGAYVEVSIVRPLQAGWRRWDGCRLVLGYALVSSEDRNHFVADRKEPGLEPPCQMPTARRRAA